MFKFRDKIALRCLIIVLLSLSTVGCGGDDRHFQGYIAGTYTYISSPISGILDQLFVNKGALVKKGDKLFILNAEPESSELKAAQHNLEQAEESLANLQKGQRKTVLAALTAQKSQVKASLHLARKTYHRYQELLKEHLIDKERFDKALSDYNFYQEKLKEVNANLSEAKLGARENLIAAQKAQVDAARANADKVKWALDQKTKMAPFAARVFDTLYNVGEVIPSSSPVVMLLAPSDIKVIFFIPERKLSQIKLDDIITFSCDGCKTDYNAKVFFISPEAEYTPPVIFSETSRDKLVYRVEARMDAATVAKMHVGQPIDVFD